MGGIRSPVFATVPMYTKRVVSSWPSFFTASIRCRVPPKLTSIDDHYRSAPSNLGRITEDRHLQKRFHSAGPCQSENPVSKVGRIFVLYHSFLSFHSSAFIVCALRSLDFARALAFAARGYSSAGARCAVLGLSRFAPLSAPIKCFAFAEYCTVPRLKSSI